MLDLLGMLKLLTEFYLIRYNIVQGKVEVNIYVYVYVSLSTIH